MRPSYKSPDICQSLLADLRNSFPSDLIDLTPLFINEVTFAPYRGIIFNGQISTQRIYIDTFRYIIAEGHYQYYLKQSICDLVEFRNSNSPLSLVLGKIREEIYGAEV